MFLLYWLRRVKKRVVNKMDAKKYILDLAKQELDKLDRQEESKQIRSDLTNRVLEQIHSVVVDQDHLTVDLLLAMLEVSQEDYDLFFSILDDSDDNKQLQESISVLCYLLQGMKEKGFAFTIYDNQKQDVKTFIRLLEREKEKASQPIAGLEEKNMIIEVYEMISSLSNKEPIKDEEKLVSLLEFSHVPESTRYQLYLSILDYNRTIYQALSNN